MTADQKRKRRRKLAVVAQARKRAAFAPKGSKAERLARLKAIVHDMLKKELSNV